VVEPPSFTASLVVRVISFLDTFGIIIFGRSFRPT